MLRKAKTIDVFDKFNLNYDDSSDEESVDSVLQFSIEKSTQIKKLYQAKSKNLLNNDELLSYIAHAAGLSVLYSKKVNAAYYKLKRSLTERSTETAVQSLRQIIKITINRSIEEATTLIHQFIKQSTVNLKSIDILQREIDSVKSNIATDIDKLIEVELPRLIANGKLLFSSDTNVSACITPFVESLITLYINKLTATLTLDSGKSDRDIIKKNIQAEIGYEIDKIIKKYKLSTKSNVGGKIKAEQELSNYNDEFLYLVKSLVGILHTANARGHVSTMLHRELSDHQNSQMVFKAYLDDLINIKLGQFKKIKLTSKQQELLNLYYVLTKNSICDTINTDLKGILRQNMIAGIGKFQRPTLGRSYTLVSHNPCGFYANLRLSNRSQKRNIANLQHAALKMDSSVRLWRLFEPDMSVADVIETQEILQSSFGRKDLVEGVGNYEKVFDLLQEVENFFHTRSLPIADKEVALWIRSIFQGEMPDWHIAEIDKAVILHKLQSITYLLLGCEAARNPSMIVINQMLIDLIIADKDWTFAAAFTPEIDKTSETYHPALMPMVAEGAVAAARAVESSYRASMPFSYSYPGYEDNSNMLLLMQSEAYIVRCWASNVAKIDSSKITTLTPQSLFELIHSQHQVWFLDKLSDGLSSDSVSMRRR